VSIPQAGVLMAQHLRGPRCFVPRCFLPQKYDYFRSAPASILPGAKADAAIRAYPTTPAAASAPGSGSSSPTQLLAGQQSGGGGGLSSRRSGSSGSLLGGGGSPPSSPRDEETGHGSIECVICMNPVEVR